MAWTDALLLLLGLLCMLLMIGLPVAFAFFGVNIVGALVFLGGDVMTGRGIDQALAHPSSPELYESFVRDARDYLRLAEGASGAVPAPVTPAYVWGDALAELDRAAPVARIVNLETSVTTSNRPWPGKGIHYRMHPANVDCLERLGADDLKALRGALSDALFD